jgi:hypothetical protein
MEKLFKNSKKWMSALGVVAFLMVAGWQVGVNGTESAFSDTEAALEMAIANSGGPGATVPCFDAEEVGSGPYRNRVCVENMKAFCQFADHGSYTVGTCNF